MVKCFVCGRTLSNKYILEIHMSNHERDEQTDLVTELSAVFGVEAKPLFSGALYFDPTKSLMSERLQRDMTESTDWNLICPISTYQ